MPDNVKDLKASHMATESARCDDAFKAIRSVLNSSDATIRALAYAFMTADRHAIYSVFGGDGRNLHSFPQISYARGIAFLENIAHFIGYQIQDDGEPGIGYMRYGFGDGFTPCNATDEDAQPYFHSCVDILRQTVPDADYLDAEKALEVLKWYADERAKLAAFDCDCFDDEDRHAFDPSPEEIQMRELADQLLDPKYKV